MQCVLFSQHLFPEDTTVKFARMTPHQAEVALFSPLLTSPGTSGCSAEAWPSGAGKKGG